MRKEIQLGLFVFFGLIALAVSILLIKNIHVGGGYRIHVIFDDVQGLLEKAWVRVSGVKVGRVEMISLFEGKKARVTIWIERNVELHKDTQAKVLSSGLLGVKYLELTLGSPDQPLLKNGDTIIGEKPTSIEQVLSKLTEEKFGESILEIVNNVKQATNRINKIVGDEKIKNFIDKLNETASNLEKISRDVAEVTGPGKQDVKVTLSNLKSITERLDRILAEIESGQSPISKLLKDKKMGEDLSQTVSALKDTSNEAKKTIARFNLFKTYWNYDLRTDTKINKSKSDLGIEIRPKEEKFYYLGVTNITTESEENPFEPENTFDLQIGRDFGPYTLFAGLIRSTGGLGIRLRPFWKWNPWSKFELSARAYDFTRKTPVKKPRVDVGAKVKIAKYVNIGMSMEDIAVDGHLNSSVNVVIDDEDLAYLLGLVTLTKPIK